MGHCAPVMKGIDALAIKAIDGRRLTAKSIAQPATLHVGLSRTLLPFRRDSAEIEPSTLVAPAGCLRLRLPLSSAQGDDDAVRRRRCRTAVDHCSATRSRSASSGVARARCPIDTLGASSQR